MDQLGHFWANQMRAEELPGLRVEECFDHAQVLAKRDRLAIRREGKAADSQLVSGGSRLGLAQSDAGNLRVAVGAAGNLVTL